MSGQGPPAAKRQRISYSAASSPIFEQPVEDLKSGVFQPRTPSSPPLTSSGSHVDAASSSPQFYGFTPPTSAPMSAEPSLQPLLASSHPSHVDQQVADPPSALCGSLLEDYNMAKPTDDFTAGIASTGATAHLIVVPPKAKTDPIPGGIDWAISDRLLYKLNGNTYPMMRPHFAQDLFKLYHLGDIATGVARYNLSTGQKHPLRKSYQNFITDVSGKNKPVAKPREFLDLLQYADNDWLDQNVTGKELENGLSSDVFSKLDRAVKMEPGKLPRTENDKWRNILDLDDQQAKSGTLATNSNRSATSKISHQPSSGVSPVTDPPRLSRRGTKRRYNEDSFEGYGEGYIDDTGDSPGADHDEDDRNGSAKKKRRRDTSNASSPTLSESLGSYGPGAISVSLGSGSYNAR